MSIKALLLRLHAEQHKIKIDIWWNSTKSSYRPTRKTIWKQGSFWVWTQPMRDDVTLQRRPHPEWSLRRHDAQPTRPVLPFERCYGHIFNRSLIPGWSRGRLNWRGNLCLRRPCQETAAQRAPYKGINVSYISTLATHSEERCFKTTF